jgi:hypothetical protein
MGLYVVFSEHVGCSHIRVKLLLIFEVFDMKIPINYKIY